MERSTIAKWEISATLPPSDMLKKVSKLFDVSIDYLAGVSSKIRTQNEALVKIQRAYNEMPPNLQEAADSIFGLGFKKMFEDENEAE